MSLVIHKLLKPEQSHHSTNEECKPEILDQIDRFFRDNNRIVATYQLIKEVETQVRNEDIQNNVEIPIVRLDFRRDRQLDSRRYNEPTTNEVGMVFVDSNDKPPFTKDIRVYPINPQNPSTKFVNISILSPNLDPMTYSIFFPYDESG